MGALEGLDFPCSQDHRLQDLFLLALDHHLLPQARSHLLHLPFQSNKQHNKIIRHLGQMRLATTSPQQQQQGDCQKTTENLRETGRNCFYIILTRDKSFDTRNFIFLELR